MSSNTNSSLWQMMAQLDAGIEQSDRRDAEKGVVQYHDNDIIEEPTFRIPLRVAQEMNGEKVGFECPKPTTPP